MSVQTTYQEFFGEPQTSIERDLALNLQKLVGESSLSLKESVLATLALSQSLGFERAYQFASKLSKELPEALSEEEVLEARQSAAIMGMNNIYYRFRHMLKEGQPESAADYKMAGLRMMSMAQPKLGKAGFEMLAFAVSVLNGCSSCINAHEKTLREHQVEVTKIHDLARLAAVLKGAHALTTLK